MTVEFADYQITGGRHRQEDSYRIMTDLHLRPGEVGDLFLLADGMGGHANGGVASELVCERFLQAFTDVDGTIPHRLNTALQLANAALRQEAEQRADTRGMGSTLIALWINGGAAQWLSVGDSALFLQRGNNLTRLNADHSMAPVLQKMVELGQITQAAADTDSKRHALRSAVSGGDIKLVDLPQDIFPLHHGDRLLLVTDGMETLGTELAEILHQTRQHSCQQSLAALFNRLEALATGDQDNTSAILIEPLAGEDSTLPLPTAPMRRPAENESETLTIPIASASRPSSTIENQQTSEAPAAGGKQQQQVRGLLFLTLGLLLVAALILGFLV